ncbi:MAG: 16S rRNA (guanine(527)-N(7))-methyltransferase RsmG [Planktotalea sp.]|uniref:16S rRNA (guanine(527)-N(7))-methyltransferase RsmG n=1 Tax=Planktotalea sp. TaxID=2029877 RepID=UPI003C786211
MDLNVGSLTVSRETMDRLTIYAELLEKWNPKINLVSRTTLSDLWTRHIVDSAQLFVLAPDGVTQWVDLGSGGGFPGLVIAILAQEFRPDLNVTLVESDQRKCAFLRTVSRETNCNTTVIAKRIEEIDPLSAEVLSARALADLTALLGFADRHLSESGICLFPKGLTWEKEVEAARSLWKFDAEAINSETQEDTVILRINEIEHA